MKRFLSWCFLLILWLACAVLPAQAGAPSQSGGQITFGQEVRGSIDDEQFRVLYTFSGEQGQVVSLSMRRESGDLDPYLILMTGPGVVVSVSDDGEGRDAVISSQNLPSTGDYVIVATRFGHEHGTTGGEFTLRLDILGSSTTIVGNTLRYGAPVIGQITDDNWEAIYLLPARRGDVVNIQMRRTSGDLDALIDLFDPTGQALFSGDDDPTAYGSLDAGIISYMIPLDGIYFIRATRYGYDVGTSEGTFILTITQTPPEALGTRPLTARYIAYGDVYSGTIDGEIFTRFYRFEAQRGDVVSVTVERQTGNIAPQISILVAEDLRPLSSTTATAGQTEARLFNVSIPETGDYLIAVSRFRGAEGTSEGTFELSFSGRAGTLGSDALEITYGLTVNGELNNEKFFETYRFAGQEGDRVRITMRRLEGNLDALLTLLDDTGKQLVADDDSVGNGTKDAIIRFQLPADAIYTLEASRFQRFAGDTTGIYELQLEKEN